MNTNQDVIVFYGVCLGEKVSSERLAELYDSNLEVYEHDTHEHHDKDTSKLITTYYLGRRQTAMFPKHEHTVKFDITEKTRTLLEEEIGKFSSKSPAFWLLLE